MRGISEEAAYERLRSAGLPMPAVTDKLFISQSLTALNVIRDTLHQYLRPSEVSRVVSIADFDVEAMRADLKEVAPDVEPQFITHLIESAIYWKHLR
jgi:hypothetical protein